MAKSNALETAILQLIYNATTFNGIAENDTTSPNTDIYVALHTGDPGEAGTQATNEAVWSQALEAGYTAEDMMKVMAAALAGEVSGAGTSTVTIRDIADTKARIVASVDGTGNRTAVTLDVD